jgi:hypothetical protein
MEKPDSKISTSVMDRGWQSNNAASDLIRSQSCARGKTSMTKRRLREVSLGATILLGALRLAVPVPGWAEENEPTLEELKARRKQEQEAEKNKVEQAAAREKARTEAERQAEQARQREAEFAAEAARLRAEVEAIRRQAAETKARAEAEAEAKVRAETETRLRQEQQRRTESEPWRAVGLGYGESNPNRFRATQCGSIKDDKTGLEWLIGADYNVDWYAAKNWVNNLRSCGGKWRMPSIAELKTLFDKRFTTGIGYYARGQHWPAHVPTEFAGIGGGSWVWSSERVGNNDAKSFNFNQGVSTTYSKDDITYATRVFAVR